MSLTVLTLLVITAKQLMGVSAQNITTTAICQPEFSWMSNTLHQSPCLIAAYLQGQCDNGVFSVDSLDPGYIYAPGDGNNACTCSTVTYSVITACALCQGAGAGNWSEWSANCSSKFSRVYTQLIPAGTAVPNWAYLDVMSADTFNTTAALADLGAPESTAQVSTSVSTATTVATATVTESTTMISTTISTESSTGTSKASSLSPDDASQRSSHVGAIAGGAVGGLVALGLIGSVIALFISRRRRNQWAPSSEYNTQPVDVPPQSPTVPQMTQENYHLADGVGAQARPRRYDPSDPNTYPTSSTPATEHTSSSSGLVPRGQSGSYNYVPEI